MSISVSSGIKRRDRSISGSSLVVRTRLVGRRDAVQSLRLTAGASFYADPRLRWESANGHDAQVAIPEVRYAKTPDGVSIAYQVVGDGPSDLLFVPGFASNLIWSWQLPSYAHFLRRLSSFCRLIIVDRRGSGISDRLSPEDLPSLEVIADDLGVVLDAVGSERASIFAADEGAHGVVLYAATHPERVERLILYAFDPMGDYQPWDEGFNSREEREALLETFLAAVIEGWGTREFALSDPLAGLEICGPSLADAPASVDWYTALLLLHSSPSGVVAFHRMYFGTDAQPILASIRVPTLLLHRVGDLLEPIDESRFIAGLIPGAKLVELEGDDHVWFAGDTDSIVDPIQEFMTRRDVLRRISTECWPRSCSPISSARPSWPRGSVTPRGRSYSPRTMSGRGARSNGIRGREIDTAGDGLTRDVRRTRASRPLRASDRRNPHPSSVSRSAWGCHTGESRGGGREGRRHRGPHRRARRCAGRCRRSAGVRHGQGPRRGERTRFDDPGEHELKGVPDRWHLYRVVS